METKICPHQVSSIGIIYNVSSIGLALRHSGLFTASIIMNIPSGQHLKVHSIDAECSLASLLEGCSGNPPVRACTRLLTVR
jgi:hypothetical protein